MRMIESIFHPRKAVRASAILAAAVCSACATATEFDWQGGVTAIWQQAHNGISSVTLSADALMSLERRGGSWFVYVEGANLPGADSVPANYPSSNADAGSVLDGTHGGVQVSEFHYTFKLRDENRLQLGLLDVSAWLDLSTVANDETAYFVNASLVNNATIAFPDYTLGAVFARPGNAGIPTLTLVASRSGGLASYARRKYEKLFDFDEAGSGAFVAAQFDWDTARTRTSLGLWSDTADYPVARQPLQMQSNYGIYATWTWADGPHAVDARLGVAHEKVSPAARFAALAYVVDTGTGDVGLGLARTWLSNKFMAADLDHRLDAELFYRVTLGDGRLQLTPSIQIVHNPEFDATGSVAKARATIFGIRFQWQTQ